MLIIAEPVQVSDASTSLSTVSTMWKSVQLLVTKNFTGLSAKPQNYGLLRRCQNIAEGLVFQ
jgi:hypothetical protein